MRLATISEAAKALGMNEQALRRRVNAGEYPFIMIGTRKMVNIDDLEKINQAKENTITIKEAAELTGLRVTTIRRGIREGWLPARKVGKEYVMLPGEVIDSIEKMKRQAKQG